MELVLVILVMLLIFLVTKKSSSSSRETSMKYPVYSPKEIEYAKADLLEAVKSTRGINELHQQIIDELKPTKFKNMTKVDQERVKESAKKIIKALVEEERLRDQYNFMLEGNLSVINSKNTIAGVRKEYEDKYLFSPPFEEEKIIEKRYEDWIRRVNKLNNQNI